MAAGLFIHHHGRPDLVRVEIAAGVIHQAFRGGFQNAIPEPLTDQAPLTVTAVGVEAVADNAASVPDDIGDNCHQTGGHFAEIDIGIANG